MGPAFENGRKAGSSSSASSSSSSADESRPTMLFTLAFPPGNCGRRVKARLWTRGGESDEEDDAGEDESAVGDGDRGPWTSFRRRGPDVAS